jgi:hypothetical protein
MLKKSYKVIPYWICWNPASKLYITEIEDDGNIIHTDDESKAYKFGRMNDAGPYFNMGYTISKKEMIITI